MTITVRGTGPGAGAPSTSGESVSRCPLCGAPNDCSLARAAGSRGREACWCMGVEVDAGLTRFLAGQAAQAACLCPRCASGDVPSPCIGVCRLDAAGGHCIGCLRTVEEIGAWSGMDAAARAAVLRRVRAG